MTMDGTIVPVRAFRVFVGRVGLMLALIGCMTPAGAVEVQTPVRYGDHPGFGRMVFDVDDGGAIAVDQSGLTVTVHLKARARLPAGAAPRNFRSVRQTGDDLTIELAQGALLRRLVVNNHLVLDALDLVSSPTLPEAVARGLSPTKAKTVAGLPGRVAAISQKATVTSVPDRVAGEKLDLGSSPADTARKVGDANVSPRNPDFAAEPEPRVVLSPPATASAPSTVKGLAPASPIQRLAGTASGAALTAEAEITPEAGPGHMLSLPFSANVGAAAFRHGRNVIVVFDDRKPIDLRPLSGDVVFSRASVQLLPAATMLTLPLPVTAELRLERRKAAWVLIAIGGDAMADALRPIQLEQNEDRLLLKADQPGLIIAVPDSATGGVLQVGTQRLAGQGISVERHTPDFQLLPTWQGVVLKPLSDGVSIRPSTEGFIIGAEDRDTRLVASPGDRATAAVQASSQMSRIFDLPNLTTEGLLRRMQSAVASAASLPPSARGQARRGVAESMLALGMGAEAQSVLALADSSDARTAPSPSARALSAATSLLSGRLADADALDDHALDGSDEIAFWRALKSTLRLPENSAAAEIFANTTPLLLSYPGALQRRFKPIAAEAMAQGGQVKAAQLLIDTSPQEPIFGLARAYLEQAKGGNPDKAISMFDALAQSQDRLVRLRAARAGAELRLASGKADAGQTAEALGKLLFAWRGDEREIELRLRIAQLQAQAKQWRPSLQLLRDTEQLWPDRGEQLKARLGETFAASLTTTSQAQVKPFDLVAMAEENADLLPDGEAGMRLAERVTDALAELDLPARAVPYLEKMIGAAPKGVVRASFGGRLAQLRLQQGDNTGALEVLKSTAAERLPPELLESRTKTFAESVARLNDLPSAADALRQLDTPSGDHLLADLAEAARNWPEVVSAMRRVVSRDVPVSGPITIAHSEALLRLASAASMAGDEETMVDLRGRDLSLLPVGRALDLLKIMLTRPVANALDLPRAAREMAMARSVPGNLPSLSRR
jgi:predicted negative regulator of RcsB-dependent stress response